MSKINFKGSSRDEAKVLIEELNTHKLETRINAVKKVISAMTVGKNVSDLFPHVLKCVESQNLELKKLVYLYIINYAKSQPDLTLMAVNTFRKDSTERVNPLIRALAVRTMGCIGIEQMVEFSIAPLQSALNDEDAYVRKTAAMCVAKVYENAPEKTEEAGLLKTLESLLKDGNGMVVSNAVAAVSEIQLKK
jgi:vesicle coat complex subunit